MKFKLAFTGGGTAGHVMPNLALIKHLPADSYDIFYIGAQGVEKDLVQHEGIRFYQIQAGKLRRYFSWQNLLDVLKVIWGFFQSLGILLREKPDLLFSKGGFVAVPVCFAAKLCGIKIVIHEADFSPGLATRLTAPLAEKILYSFPESARYFDTKKSECTGLPIREEILSGDAKRGLQLLGLSEKPHEPILLVMGGSLGAQKINDVVLQYFSKLAEKFFVVHLTGKGKSSSFQHGKYRAFEFLGPELRDIFAIADICISRSGASAVFELDALGIPMLLIPLEVGSRGDQILNAESFAKSGKALVIREAKLTYDSLSDALTELLLKPRQPFQAPESTAVSRCLQILHKIMLV